MNKCCPDHPETCPSEAWQTLISIVIVAATFGLRWAALLVFVDCELNWLIRTWKHKS